MELIFYMIEIDRKVEVILKVKWLKKLYNAPKDRAWLYLKRAGHRAELYHYYKPKM